jgi:hypothetical protein
MILALIVGWLLLSGIFVGSLALVAARPAPEWDTAEAKSWQSSRAFAGTMETAGPELHSTAVGVGGD